MAFRQRDIEALIEATEKGIEKAKKMNEKYPKMYRDTALVVCESVITEWYSKYDPIVYNRRGSLYNMYHVKLNGTKLIVDIDGEGLEGLDEYLYNLTFVEGYHGGAKRGISYFRDQNGNKLMAFPHPHEGIPYWKTPIPEFYRWGRPALQSFSPYYKIIRELDKQLGEIDKKKQSEFDNIVNKIQRIIDRF